MNRFFTELLESAIFFQGFPCVNGQFFQTSFAEIFRNMLFLQCDFQYIVSKNQPVGSAHEVLAESLKTVYHDEAHFIVNLHNFLHPYPSLDTPFPTNEPFLQHSPGRTTSKTLPLQTHQKKPQCIYFPQFSNIGWKIKRIK